MHNVEPDTAGKRATFDDRKFEAGSRALVKLDVRKCPACSTPMCYKPEIQVGKPMCDHVCTGRTTSTAFGGWPVGLRSARHPGASRDARLQHGLQHERRRAPRFRMAASSATTAPIDLPLPRSDAHTEAAQCADVEALIRQKHTQTAMNGCTFNVLAFISLIISVCTFQECCAAKIQLQPKEEECISATVGREKSQVSNTFLGIKIACLHLS